MCQILSLFKIEFRNNKINFVDEDRKETEVRSPKTGGTLPEREAVEGSITSGRIEKK